MNKKGFTLIEVLTVIMIIAILASVVLVSLETARKRTKDSTIQHQIGQLRALLEASYSLEKGYEDISVTGHPDNKNYILIANKIGDMGSSSGLVFEFNDPLATGYSKEYCAYANLVRNPAEIFCVDSTGNAVVLNENDDKCDGTTFYCEAECLASGQTCTTDSECCSGTCTPSGCQ